MKNLTDPEEFKKFHQLLTLNAPQEYEPYYFTLEPCGKEPRGGKSWKKNRKTFKEAYTLMEKGFNIGIAATDLECDTLCIMDIDDLTQVTRYKGTLEVTSRKRIGRHCYYVSPRKTAKLNIATEHAGEMRCKWQYVLAPGSYVPCSEEEIARMPAEEKQFAGRYTVRNPRPVSEIEFSELPQVYRDRYTQARNAELEAAKRIVCRANRPAAKIIKYRSKLWDMDVTDVSGVRPTGKKYVPMPDEIHGSETGHNCCVDNGLMHCWRHNTTLCAFAYLAVAAGMTSCERAGMPHGSRSYGIDFQDGETIFEVWRYAKARGFIPENDPIPHNALIYYALNRGVCRKKDLVEGKLTDTLYAVTLMMAKREGLNFGRSL